MSEQPMHQKKFCSRKHFNLLMSLAEILHTVHTLCVVEINLSAVWLPVYAVYIIATQRGYHIEWWRPAPYPPWAALQEERRQSKGGLSDDGAREDSQRGQSQQKVLQKGQRKTRPETKGQSTATSFSLTICTLSHWQFCDFRKHFHIKSKHLNLLYFVKKTFIMFTLSVCRRLQRMTKTEPTAQWRMDQEKDLLFLQQRVCSLDKRYWFDSAHNCPLLSHQQWCFYSFYWKVLNLPGMYQFCLNKEY